MVLPNFPGMNTSTHQLRNQRARDAFIDVATIFAVALIGLVLLVVTNPRFGHDLDTLLRPAATHSDQVTHQAAGS
jgi:hypothetical protein